MNQNQIKHNRARYYRGCRCDLCVADWTRLRLRRQEQREIEREKRRRDLLDAEPLLRLVYEQVDPHSSLGRKMRYWRANGVDIYTADKLCCELGYHPFEVFGDAWWKGAFDE